MVKENVFQRVWKLADIFRSSGGTVPVAPTNTDPLAQLMKATGQDTNQLPLWQNWFIHKRAIGSTGTETYAGYPREEYLPEMLGSDRAKIFDKMWRSDPQCTMLIAAVVNQISSAIWEVEPDPENPDSSEAKRKADLIRHILLKNLSKEGGFQQFVDEALSAMRAGHAVFEKTYKLVVDDPKFGTFHGIEGLDLISAKTINRWNLDDKGKLASITQLAIGDLYRYLDIPSNFLMVLSLNREGSNYEGVSLLRPCYGAFIRKNLMHKLNIIGIERFAVKTPIVDIPDGKQNNEQYANLIAALEVYTSGQANYLTKPSVYKIDFAQGATYDPELVDIAIENEDRRMAKAFVAGFLEFGKSGSSSGKSQGMSDLSDFFLSGIERIANSIAQMVNENLIPELCRYNFGNENLMPQLKHSGITDKAGETLANALSALCTAGVIEPDDPLEDNIRKRFQFPKKSILGARGPTVPGMFGVPKPVDPNAPPHPEGQHPTDPTKAAPKPAPLPPGFNKGKTPGDGIANEGKTLAERIRRRIRA